MSAITIHDTQMPIVEYQGHRVVTVAMIDQVHGRPEGTAKRNFHENRQRFRDGEDCFLVPKSEADGFRTFGIEVPNRGLTVLTESGYLMITKSLTDDLAWDVQRQLVNSYFRKPAAPAPALPSDYIQALEHLLESKRSEQLAIEQRDHAIRTKAQIGSKREAQAMAKASSAVRQVKRLENELGQGCRQATVTAVEIATGQKLPINAYVPLRKWCKAQGITPEKVPDRRFGEVAAWPAGAWLDVYDIDLASIFEPSKPFLTLVN